MEPPASKDYQPDRTDIGFAALVFLTWTMLAWFAQQQHGRLPLALAGIASLCLLFSYSLALTGNCLERIGWTAPARHRYWLVALASGAGGSYTLVLFLRLTGTPLPIRDPRLPVFVLAVTVGPILEEVVFRGLILSALL